MIYIKPTIKSLVSNDITEEAGPLQTAYAQVMWVQTQPIVYNQQVHTNQLADATIVKLEKKA
jgi:hypothetical protein